MADERPTDEELNALLDAQQSGPSDEELNALLDSQQAPGEDSEPINESDFQDLGFVDAQIEAVGRAASNIGSIAGKGLEQAVRIPRDLVAGTPEERQAVIDDFSRGLGVVGETAKSLASAAADDPLGAAGAVADVGGNVVATAGGAALGTVAPGGTVAGAYLGNLGWRAFSDFVGLSDGEFGVDKSFTELSAETTEELTGDAITAGLGKLAFPKATKVGAVRRQARKGLARSAERNSRLANLKKLFGENAGQVKKDALDFSTETLGGDILDGVIASSGGKLPEPGKVADQIVDFLRGARDTRGLRRAGGAIDVIGKEVDDAIAQSTTKFGLDDVKSLTKEAMNVEVAGDISREVGTSLKAVQKPFLRRLGAKADISAKDVDDYVDDLGLLETLEKKQRVRGKLSRADGEIALRATQRVQEMQSKLSTVELTPLEFFESVRDVTNKTVVSANIPRDQKLKMFADLRAGAQARIESGLDEAGRAAYQRANDRYFSAVEIADWIEPARVAEMKSIGEDQLAVLEVIRYGRDLRFGNTPKSPLKWDLFINAVQASDRPSRLRSVLERVTRGVAESDNLNDLFSLKNVVAVESAIENAQRLIGSGEIAPDQEESLSEFIGGAQQFIAEAEPLIDGDMSAKRAAAKRMKSLPGVKAFIPVAQDNPHLQGVDIVGDEFLSQEDEQQYRRNLQNDESLSNRDRVKAIDHLNRFGKPMKLASPEPLLSNEDKARIEEESRNVVSLRELSELRSPRAIVKQKQMAQLIEETSE